MAEDRVLAYEAPPRVSRLAIGVFWAAVGSAFLFFLVVPPLILFLVALWAQGQVAGTLDTRGQRYANAAAMISIGACVLGVLFLILMPSHAGHPIHSARAVCASNLRGIMIMMNVYAADNNDKYPIVAFAPYSAGLNDVKAAAGPAKADDAIREYYNPPHRQAGSVQAILWQLVLRGDVRPKSFLCRNDPLANVPASVATAAGGYYDNFQAAHQLSYSMAYPWKADGTVGTWWTSTTDASLPMMADVTPEHGTGTPVRNMTPAAKPANPATWNSTLHEGYGQNVAFADTHVEFTRSPDCGQRDDNIYAASGTPSRGPAQFGGVPAGKTMPLLTADTPPYDMVMLPVRNASTGAH
jgi:hypothetical protein